MRRVVAVHCFLGEKRHEQSQKQTFRSSYKNVSTDMAIPTLAQIEEKESSFKAHGCVMPFKTT